LPGHGRDTDYKDAAKRIFLFDGALMHLDWISLVVKLHDALVKTLRTEHKK
jgi:hypothetical protein